MNNAHQNGDDTSLVAVSHGLNGISAKVYISANDNHPSPATDSPATPLDSFAPPDVTIDFDYQEQESDVRHEPLPVKHFDPIDKLDDASTLANPLAPSMVSSVHVSRLLSHFFLSSSVLGTIPIHSGTPPGDDVKIVVTNGLVNGHSQDVVMGDGDSQTPAATPGISADFSMASLEGSTQSATRSYPEDSDDHEPPTKRARKHSDADMASLTHVSLFYINCTPFWAC